jgi:hypothetical protein
MKVADLEKQQEIFYQLINQVEIDYHLYFGLKSIQKKLDHTESIYDHFKLDPVVGLIFNADSDLPEEIRDIIIKAYHQVFF